MPVVNVGVDVFHHFDRFQSSSLGVLSGCWHGIACVDVKLDTKDWFGDAFFHEAVPAGCDWVDQFGFNVLWDVLLRACAGLN